VRRQELADLTTQLGIVATRSIEKGGALGRLAVERGMEHLP
jgi:hypothetical protein